MTTAILSTDDLRRVAPSIYAATPWEGVSSSYRFVPTSEVLGMMQDQGFYPVLASQSRTRIPGKQPYTKHLVRLRHADFLGGSLAEETPEIVLVNAHDKTSSYKIFSGIMRLVCSNGMIVQSEDYGSFSLHHSGSRDLRQQVIDTTCEVVAQVPAVMKAIGDWRSTTLSRPQQLALASAASELKPSPSITPAQLLTSRRVEDDTDQEGNRDLWRTINVLQESLIRGGIQGRNPRGRKVTTKAIKSVGRDSPSATPQFSGITWLVPAPPGTPGTPPTGHSSTTPAHAASPGPQ